MNPSAPCEFFMRRTLARGAIAERAASELWENVFAAATSFAIRPLVTRSAL
jgi:hypothetical protein